MESYFYYIIKQWKEKATTANIPGLGDAPKAMDQTRKTLIRKTSKSAKATL